MTNDEIIESDDYVLYTNPKLPPTLSKVICEAATVMMRRVCSHWLVTMVTEINTPIRGPAWQPKSPGAFHISQSMRKRQLYTAWL